MQHVSLKLGEERPLGRSRRRWDYSGAKMSRMENEVWIHLVG